MQLSMWMIADALSGYECKLDINSGLPEIRGARFLAQEEFPSPDIVYIGVRGEPAGGHISQHVVCRHKTDSIVVRGESQQMVFNRLLNLFDTCNACELAMETAARSGDSPQQLLLAAAGILRGGAWIVERGGRVCGQLEESMGGSQPFLYSSRGDTYMRSESLQCVANRAPTRAGGNRVFEVPELSLFCRDLFDRRHRVGMLMLEAGAMLGPSLLTAADWIGTHLERWLSEHQERSVFPRNGNVLQQLLSPQPNPACVVDFSNYLGALGWESYDTKLLYLIRPSPGLPPDRIIQRLKSGLPDAVSTVFGTDVVLLVNKSVSGEAAISAAIRALLLEEKHAIGISYPFQKLAELYQALCQAQLALSSGGANAGTMRSCVEYMSEYVYQLIGSQISSDLSHPALAVLNAYDTSHRTQMLDTLGLYLLCERNQKRTSELLSLHRNTLFYRLNKIQELCGLELDNPHTRMQLILSFIIRYKGRLPTEIEQSLCGDTAI